MDLKGFTITGGGDTDMNHASYGVSIGDSSGGTNAYPITVKNGTLVNFTVAIDASQNGHGGLTNLSINKLTISHPQVASVGTIAVHFIGVTFSIVNRCDISYYAYGIANYYSAYPGLSNRFTGNTFTFVGAPLFFGGGYQSGTTPIMLEIPVASESN